MNGTVVVTKPDTVNVVSEIKLEIMKKAIRKPRLFAGSGMHAIA